MDLNNKKIKIFHGEAYMGEADVDGEENIITPDSEFISESQILKICRDLSRLGFVALLILTGIGIYRVFSQGWNPMEIGYAAIAFFSVMLISSYPHIVIDVKQKGKSWLALLVFLGFIPYGLGCYVFFYEGIWQSILSLRTGEGMFWTIVRGLWFMFLGFSSVSAIHKLSTFGNSFQESKIKIKPE